ncbi:MAG TPA: GNAT family N-acetyltransferase [Thermoleophilaceae bacterium]|nr:GNAT family N-acetyltransferase [Thermoleophilaceae bacterium]
MDVGLEQQPLGAPGAASLLEAFAAEIAELYPGWNPAVGPSAAPEDFDASTGTFLVAYAGERAVGCGGLKRLEQRRAEIKRLYVAPAARGGGVARRILRGLELAARARGYDSVRLDTGARQPAALALFRSAGYLAIADYNANPFASHWLEKQLTPGVRKTPVQP